ncbi:MAG: DUF4400 domain-containing protein [Pedobacter sp.]
MSTADSAEDSKRGLIGQTIHIVFTLIGAYIGSLLLSIIIELLGIGLDWWELPGAQHAKMSLETELGWLNEDFKQFMVAPVDVAFTFLSFFYEYIIQATYFGSLVVALKGTVVEPYFLAVVYIIELNAVRLAVILMSMPALLLFGMYALIDGLNERDVRTWSGGRETSFVYHHAKRWALPAAYMAIVVYLSSPVSVHPSLFVLLFALPFSYSIWLTAMYFKKYL